MLSQHCCCCSCWGIQSSRLLSTRSRQFRSTASDYCGRGYRGGRASVVGSLGMLPIESWEIPTCDKAAQASRKLSSKPRSTGSTTIHASLPQRRPIAHKNGRDKCRRNNALFKHCISGGVALLAPRTVAPSIRGASGRLGGIELPHQSDGDEPVQQHQRRRLRGTQTSLMPAAKLGLGRKLTRHHSGSYKPK
jgi:hypothetical protein